MKITVFEGNSGDCLLLSSSGGKNILVDGGLVKTSFGNVDAYSFNVASTLSKLREDGGELDLVCVSHVDQDHIGGILRMLNDEFEWRVFKHQKAQGLQVSQPDNPRPPSVKEIWHNAFHEQLGKNSGPIIDAIAAAAPAWTTLGVDRDDHGGNTLDTLVNSMKEAAQVSRRIGAKQLNIPLNAAFGGKLVLRTSPTKPIDIGDLTCTVLGPTSARLKALRDKWNAWLRSQKGKKQVRSVGEAAKEDEQALINGDFASLFDLASFGGSLGDRDDVTPQNVASITMIVEEAGMTALLTGDARDDHVHEDLVAAGLTRSDETMHVNMLKIPHHGSENNFSPDFARHVTADHYVFCGNGAHGNPEPEVVDAVIDSRLGSASRRSKNPEAAQPFKLWFTSDGSTFKADKDGMDAVMKIVKKRAKNSNPKMSFHFSKTKSFSIAL